MFLDNETQPTDGQQWGPPDAATFRRLCKNRRHVYEFLNLPSSFLVDFACDAVGPPHYCHQQGMIRKPLPVEELFINTDPEDGGDVDMSDPGAIDVRWVA